MDFRADGGDAGRATNEFDRVNLLNGETGFFYSTLKWRGNAVKNVDDELLVLFPRES